MRLVKIPAYGDQGGDISKSVARAEEKFLESLRAEAKRPVKPRGRGRAGQVLKKPGAESRGLGQGMGAAFARLNGNNQQVESFAAAIKTGVRAAKRRDAMEAVLLNDPDHLRGAGFNGCDEDDPDRCGWGEVLRGAKF
jgi:hypothetical protein